MSQTARRLVLATTTLLGLALTACTNPVAPAGPETRTVPAERPAGSSSGVYMGSVG